MVINSCFFMLPSSQLRDPESDVVCQFCNGDQIPPAVRSSGTSNQWGHHTNHLQERHNSYRTMRWSQIGLLSITEINLLTTSFTSTPPHTHTHKTKQSNQPHKQKVILWETCTTAVHTTADRYRTPQVNTSQSEWRRPLLLLVALSPR